MAADDSGSPGPRAVPEVFPGMPVDVARLIFEKAMEDSPMPVHLALVSRQVQQW
jgi:hypothetical protein